MNPSWLLLVTQGLKVWLPPEIYLQRELAISEAARWREIFRIPDELGIYSHRRRGLHLIRTLFPEPWRACPVRVGYFWSVRSYPKMRIELMAADEREGTAWLRRRLPKSVDIAGDQLEFQRRGVTTGVGNLRAKRVMGF